MRLKVNLEPAQELGRVVVADVTLYGELLREFKGHFISRVKARHKEYALGTVHGMLLRELKVV